MPIGSTSVVSATERTAPKAMKEPAAKAKTACLKGPEASSSSACLTYGNHYEVFSICYSDLNAAG